MSQVAPEITLIVAGRNEGERLESTLRSALNIKPPVNGLEISVIDDASSDSSSAFLEQDHWTILRQQGQVRLKRLRERHGVSRARRQGALGARGEILVFADAHLDFPQQDFWLELSKRFEDPTCGLLAIDCFDSGEGGISSAGMVYSSKRLCHSTPVWVPHNQGKPLEMQQVPFVNGGFFAIRRSIYLQLEGFPDCLQGWGHEDRLLSMLAGLKGHHCYCDQRLKVGHYFKKAFSPDPSGMLLTPCTDPLPGDGIQDTFPVFIHAQNGTKQTPTILLNSLRCAVLLYDQHHFAMTVEQLKFDYGEDSVKEAIALIQQERPQLLDFLERIGLQPNKRDQAFHDFCDRFRPFLPMLDEAELQFIAAIPEPHQALGRVRRLPRKLHSLASPDFEHYECARLYREAALQFAGIDIEVAATLLGELLQIDPDFLPAIRMLTIALRALRRSQGERFWLLHGVAVVDRHRQTTSPRPVEAYHPASMNPYLRNLYWPKVDREFWQALAELELLNNTPAAALPWLARLLEQTPNDPQVLLQLQELSQPKRPIATAGSKQ